MSVKIYGTADSRVGVRQITPQIYWICHCIGHDAAHYNGGFASDANKTSFLIHGK